MKDGESVDEYFARTLEIANKMKAEGKKMDQMVIDEKILRSITSQKSVTWCVPLRRQTM